jgi:transposase
MRFIMQNKAPDHSTANSVPHGSPIAWLGLDAHAQNCVLAHLENDGTQRQFWRIPTEPARLVAQVQAIAAADKRLALEESNLARWLWQLLRPHVTQLVVCDARHNKLISAHPNKKDPRDAFGLARLFRLNELKPVWQVPTQERALFKSAAQSYEEAVLRQTQLKQQIKSTFQHWGLFPTGTRLYSAEGRGAWCQRLPHSDLRAQVDLLYASMEQAVQTQADTRKLMVRLGKAFPEVKLLSSAPGLGVVGAHLFAAYIADPKRFDSGAGLIRYCRLGIRDRTSDDKPLGYEQLDRHGHGVLKAISYRAWLQAMKRRDTSVYQFFQWSKQHTGSAVHARLNTQRKLLRAWWTLWKRGEEWDEKRFFPTLKHN